jgi:hypothetical protein
VPINRLSVSINFIDPNIINKHLGR